MENELQPTIELAVRKHANQMRKSGFLPYISHPFDVLKKICVWGITDLNMHKAALAHDLLEDTDVTHHELKLVIGETAFDYVVELTCNIDPDSQYSKRQQKEAYLLSFGNKSNQALIIKLADRFANISDFMSNDDPYAEIYKNQAKPLFEKFLEKEKELEDQFGRKLVVSIRNEFDLLDILPKEMSSLFRGCVNSQVVNKYK
jgi:(p)ppGpp synthase/HD superfamily hydrolase